MPIYSSFDYTIGRLICPICTLNLKLDNTEASVWMFGELVISVIANQTHFEEIKTESLEVYPNLKSLRIVNTGLKDIQSNAFSSLGRLEEINLTRNRLQTLSWQLFENKELKKIVLGGNPLICGCGLKWMEVHKLARQLQSVTCINDNETESVIRETKFDNCDTPVLKATPQLVNAEQGDNITLQCQSFTSSNNAEWSIQGLTSNYSISSVFNESTTILDIFNILSEDMGDVDCSASNFVGRSIESVQLRIFSPPKILSLQPARRFYRSIIECVVRAYPEPNLTWYKEGNEIQFNGGKWKPFEKPNNGNQGIWRSGLIGKIDNYEYSGKYTLVAQNSYGTDTKMENIKFNNSVPMIIRGGEFNWIPNRFPNANLNPITNSTEEKERIVEDNEDDAVKIYISVGCSAMFVVLVCIVAIFGARRFRSRKKRCKQDGFPTNNGHKPMLRTNGEIYKGLGIHRDNLPLASVPLIENPNYQGEDGTRTIFRDSAIRYINSGDISIMKEIGQGAFGCVFLGKCNNLFGDGITTPVAVKTLQDNSEELRKENEREVELHTNLIHENIVKFYGVSSQNDKLMIIVEYMENGDLNNYLRCHGPDAPYLCRKVVQLPVMTIAELLHIANQIAAGMEYLASQHFVHRDLATRNCLVGQKLIVKVGDFGMSRDIYSTDYYKVGGSAMLPIRWMPPESVLYRTFTVESDVWSFGVVLWEIFTYGKQPWYELSNNEVIQKIQDGDLLKQPELCSDGVYEIMVGCWNQNPSMRLTIKEIHQLLDSLCLSQPNYLDLIA